MEVLARIRVGNRDIDFALATTRQERAAVLAQRFRVYQRKGYYRPGLRVDRDHWDRKAPYFLALLRDEEGGGVLLGSARLIVGESVPEFRFHTEENFELELPAVIQETALCERAEVSRVVAEATRGVVIGGLLTPLGLLHAMAEYSRPRGIRLLRALQAAGVCVHEIEPVRLISPEDSSMSGYFYRHADPVIPTYWLTDKVVPSIERAISAYRTGYSTPSGARDLPTSSSATTHRRAASNDSSAVGCLARAVPTPQGSQQADPLAPNGPAGDRRRIP